MNIKPMLARLESSIGRDDLSDRILLLPGTKNRVIEEPESVGTVTLAVGYNGSANSHAALDLTLLIAHQTRLATSKQVAVKVVYVIDESESSDRPNTFNSYQTERMLSEFLATTATNSATSVLTQTKINPLATLENSSIESPVWENNSFAQAERILWQARYLVEEWRDSFAAHLRIGEVATELRSVVELEAANLLVLGCFSPNHSIVEKLGDNVPCPVLGIPHFMDESSPN